MVAVPHFAQEGICLNHQTVGNLKKYLAQFPDNAKVVIHSADRTGDYRNFDCQIGCNFEHQHQENIVQFILGWMIDGTEDN